MDIKAKLAELGYELPPAPAPVAAYVPYVESDGQLYLSGALPLKDGQLTASGALGTPNGPTLEQAQAAAVQCALNALAQVDAALKGDWSRLVRIVRLGVFVASDPSFTDQHKVANGASELLGEVFGAVGIHARSAVGVPSLPLGAAVEMDLIASLD
ncbi:MAG: RidA family protein [Phycisphaeraceae bacterium]|nr:RidA family protein [Phycisphaeraceae bacterium]